jgi:hypothetical protein
MIEFGLASTPLAEVMGFTSAQYLPLAVRERGMG